MEESSDIVPQEERTEAQEEEDIASTELHPSSGKASAVEVSCI